MEKESDKQSSTEKEGERCFALSRVCACVTGHTGLPVMDDEAGSSWKRWRDREMGRKRDEGGAINSKWTAETER